MCTVNINDELIEQVKKYIQTDYIEYPSIKNFCEKAIKEKLNLEICNRAESKIKKS